MKIKLTGIEAYYINLYSQEDRGNATYDLLHSLGFHSIKRAPGFPRKNKTLGCSLAHHNVLKSLAGSGKPFLLFEDDIELTHFDHIIDIPDDADAVYLGVSKMGMVSNKDVELLIVDKVNEYDHIYRIYNMLAAHAVLYLNTDYLISLIEEIEKMIELELPADIAMANHMRNGNVYALDKPMFIQKDKFRYFTDTAISKLPGVAFNSN